MSCDKCKELEGLLGQRTRERDEWKQKYEHYFTEIDAERVKQITELERERDETKTVLKAWQESFGTTQLTHAIAKLDRGVEAVLKIESIKDHQDIEDSWDLIAKEDIRKLLK